MNVCMSCGNQFKDKALLCITCETFLYTTTMVSDPAPVESDQRYLHHVERYLSRFQISSF
jgi:hypothetical protein